MDREIASNLWFTRDFERIFLIPSRTVVMPGMDAIYDLQENQKLVDLDTLSSCECSRDEAKDYLQSQWQSALASTKQAWLDLYTFSQKTGAGIDLDEFGKQFQQGLQMAGPQAQEIFDASRAFVESVNSAAQTQDDTSDGDQKALFKQVFSQLPQLLDQFSDANIEAAAEDPEAWADKLYHSVFAKLDKEKVEKRKRDLAKSVRASIAKGLRSAGMEPLADWDKKPGDV